MMKTYVLYHGSCADGFGAALAAWLKFGDQAEYIPVYHYQAPPPIDQGSTVYVLDFSYPRATLERLARDVCEMLVVLDHHATAQQELEGLPYCIFDMAKSGAVLAWHYFFPTRPVPDFFLLLQDRDLWQFRLPRSREVSMALRSYAMTFLLWNNLMNEVPRLMQEGVTCKRLIDQQVENICLYSGWAWINGRQASFHPRSWNPPANASNVVPCVNAPYFFFSECGERLLELFPAAPFVACFTDGNDGKRTWGMRSRPGFDLGPVAKAAGGGGHPQAAGFSTPAPMLVDAAILNQLRHAGTYP